MGHSEVECTLTLEGSSFRADRERWVNAITKESMAGDCCLACPVVLWCHLVISFGASEFGGRRLNGATVSKWPELGPSFFLADGATHFFFPTHWRPQSPLRPHCCCLPFLSIRPMPGPYRGFQRRRLRPHSRLFIGTTWRPVESLASLLLRRKALGVSSPE